MALNKWAYKKLWAYWSIWLLRLFVPTYQIVLRCSGLTEPTGPVNYKSNGLTLLTVSRNAKTRHKTFGLTRTNLLIMCD
jgi:hypothetical protein